MMGALTDDDDALTDTGLLMSETAIFNSVSLLSTEYLCTLDIQPASWAKKARINYNSTKK